VWILRIPSAGASLGFHTWTGLFNTFPFFMMNQREICTKPCVVPWNMFMFSCKSLWKNRVKIQLGTFSRIFPLKLWFHYVPMI
jgi:hypothetical protein